MKKLYNIILFLLIISLSTLAYPYDANSIKEADLVNREVTILIKYGVKLSGVIYDVMESKEETWNNSEIIEKNDRIINRDGKISNTKNYVILKNPKENYREYIIDCDDIIYISINRG